ncbi:hypothetical protein C0J45_2004 [Silurus meridionalis]|nr:hypothetical protein C0J45_2004 [Silurus meridionalis]
MELKPVFFYQYTEKLVKSREVDMLTCFGQEFNMHNSTEKVYTDEKWVSTIPNLVLRSCPSDLLNVIPG